ncbi:ABC transporter permease [Dyadobacter sp. LJ53]|uniref:ABC transporter permease n=1 Tax=Dyadobacter chenwenxiniae TaxID=2906456 RepID=UPI001F348D6A|nr:ABC transporter permease [Dyadobacter chenwenxiniae]MCF0052630.1 ABC transporter permease [Dyadobacter chenwenxiniae]
MKLFYAEFIKLKNTFALWLTLLGALFIPLILFGTYMSDVKAFVPGKGISPWDDFLVRMLNGCCFFSTGFVLLIIGLIIQIEHKANAWKHLFSLPVSKGRIYIGKLMVILTMVLVFFAFYISFSVASGVALGYVIPDFGFLQFPVPTLHLFRFVTEFFISILPTVFLQYWLSFRIKSLIISLGIGLGGLMMGLLLKSWEHIIYLPYAAPFQMLNYKEGSPANFQNLYLLNAVYTILFLSLSYKYFTKRFRG